MGIQLHYILDTKQIKYLIILVKYAGTIKMWNDMLLNLNIF